MKYFGDLQVTKSAKDMAGLLKSYRDKLLELYINQRLGDKYLRDYFPILSKGRDELLDKKKELDLRLLKNRSLIYDMIDDYNKLFNESLARFQAQMPKDLYQQFFGLAYDEEIDMRIFFPKK